ncbi:MAG: BamA/TamA family outer membrane protein [Parachlamydiales bacterium]|nr:BamA/TamA family outer membrane protein [Parachlamydiales bacterium]
MADLIFSKRALRPLFCFFQKRGQAFFICFFLLLSSFVFAEGDPYKVAIRGVGDPTLRNVLELNSQLFGMQSHPPASAMSLRLRADGDIPQFMEVLHSYGYYSARVSFRIFEDEDPTYVIVDVEPGPVYTFSQVKISAPKHLSEEQQERIEIILNDTVSFKKLGFEMEKPALASQILDGEQKIIDQLIHSGYLFARVTKRLVVVDQTTKHVEVFFEVDPGRLIYFGEIEIEGLYKVSEEWIRQKVTMKTGTVYNPELVLETRRNLETTGLFVTIEIVNNEAASPEGYLPITIRLVEGKTHSISAGISYSTDESFGLAAGWENRNLRGLGETLSINGSANDIVQEASILYRKPDFRRQREDLVWQLQHRSEFLKSYDDRSTSLSATIERRLNRHLYYSWGLKLEALHTFQDGQQADYVLFSVPLRLKWTRSNNKYAPSHGYLLDLRFTPYTDLTESNHTFTVQRATGIYIFPIIGRDRLVGVAKVGLGFIAGPSTRRIPPSIRFYEGSYNGLRGYTYQTVSPLDGDGDPIGGRSLVLYSLETRLKLTNKFSFIPFFDAGNTYKAALPPIGAELLKSYGFGVSYLTVMGPVRIDLAIPCEPRKGLDKRFEVYFSLGATF